MSGYKVLDPKKQLGTIITIRKRLNVNKVRNGENGSSYYIKMKDWFLTDLDKLVGTPQGMTRDKGRYQFWLNGHDMIWFMIIEFDSSTGLYLGPQSINVRPRRTRGSGIVCGAREYKQFRTDEVNQLLTEFEQKATELGYLK